MRRTVILLSILLLAVILLWRMFPDLCCIFLLAALIAFLLRPFVDRIARKHSRRIAAGMVLILTIFLILGLAGLIFPLFSDSFAAWKARWGDYQRMAEEWLVPLRQLLSRFGITFSSDSGPLASVVQMVMEKASGLAGKMISSVAGIGLLLITVYYLLVADTDDMDWLWKLLPPVLQDKLQSLLQQISRMLRAYFRSRLLMALFLSVSAGVGLYLLGAEYAFLYAVLLFVLDFVPYFGPLIAVGLPVFAISAEHGALRGLLVLLLLVLIQQIEESVIGPRLQADAVGVHPLIGIFSLVIGVRIFGAAGVILSLPAAGVIRIVCTELLQDDSGSDKIRWMEKKEKPNGV